jgi:regulator of protease activity HflC (stomatin/prohibitin superfamily)
LKNTQGNDLRDRRSASAASRAALIAAFRDAHDVTTPDQAARQAERKAIADAREERRVERERAKAEEKRLALEQATAQQAEIDARAQAEAEAREKADRDQAAWLIADQAARKAERDRRYAARKARQR